MRQDRYWRNYYLWESFLPFLKPGEQLRLQALNRFSYEYPINWVQDYVELAEPSYFSWHPVTAQQQSLFKIGRDCKMVPQRLVRNCFDFFDVYTVMIGEDKIYGFKHNCRPATFTVYSNLCEDMGSSI